MVNRAASVYPASEASRCGSMVCKPLHSLHNMQNFNTGGEKLKSTSRIKPIHVFTHRLSVQRLIRRRIIGLSECVVGHEAPDVTDDAPRRVWGCELPVSHHSVVISEPRRVA
jgi:hypothetical protein